MSNDDNSNEFLPIDRETRKAIEKALGDDTIQFVPDDVLGPLEQLEQQAVADAMSIAEEPLDVQGLEEVKPVRLQIPFSVRKPLHKTLLSGITRTGMGKPKVKKSWINGALLSPEEVDKLTLEEIREANDNLGRRYK